MDMINKKVKVNVPGYSDAFGLRLKQMVERIGTNAKAAEILGIKAEMNGKYCTGKAKPSFFNMQKLAEASDMSLDWLANGREYTGAESMPLDPALLSDVVEQLEEELAARNLELPPKTKARLVPLLYQYFQAEERLEERQRFSRQLFSVV